MPDTDTDDHDKTFPYFSDARFYQIFSETIHEDRSRGNHHHKPITWVQIQQDGKGVSSYKQQWDEQELMPIGRNFPLQVTRHALLGLILQNNELDIPLLLRPTSGPAHFFATSRSRVNVTGGFPQWIVSYFGYLGEHGVHIVTCTADTCRISSYDFNADFSFLVS